MGILKKSLIMILAVFSTFGTLGKVSALDLEDIKGHLSKHKVAYGVSASVGAVAVVALTLLRNTGATNLPIEEDDDDLEEMIRNMPIL